MQQAFIALYTYQCFVFSIALIHKFHNAPVPQCNIFVTEMCTYVQIAVTKLCLVEYLPYELRDFV